MVLTYAQSVILNSINYATQSVNALPMPFKVSFENFEDFESGIELLVKFYQDKSDSFYKKLKKVAKSFLILDSFEYSYFKGIGNTPLEEAFAYENEYINKSLWKTPLEEVFKYEIEVNAEAFLIKVNFELREEGDAEYFKHSEDFNFNSNSVFDIFNEVKEVSGVSIEFMPITIDSNKPYDPAKSSVILQIA